MLPFPICFQTRTARPQLAEAGHFRVACASETRQAFPLIVVLNLVELVVASAKSSFSPYFFANGFTEPSQLDTLMLLILSIKSDQV